MSRKGHEFFEEKQFNDYAYAVDVRDACEAQLAKCKIALIIAGVSSLCFLVPWLWVLGIAGSIASYILGGGLGAAFKAAGKIATIGWLIVPFPFDLMTGLCCMVFSMMAFIVLPILFVFCNYLQLKKDLNAAEEYLSYCR